MKSNNKQRAAKEAIYEKDNKDFKSVCSGRFYKKNSKTYEQCKNCYNCIKYKQYNSRKSDTPEVKFHYIDTFRSCEFYKIGSNIIKTAIYNILYVNDLACYTVYNLFDLVKKQDKETRKIYGALLKRYKRYDHALFETLDDQISYVAEYNSAMEEQVMPKLNDFIDAMNNAIKGVNSDNYSFIALVEVARTMVGYSVMNVENRVKECLKFKKDSVYLRQYKLTEMCEIVENLSRWCSRKCKGLDLNKCENVMNAYRSLDKILTDVNIINNSIIKSSNNA